MKEERYEFQKKTNDGEWVYCDGCNCAEGLKNHWKTYDGNFYSLVGAAEIRVVQILPEFEIIWNELI